MIYFYILLVCVSELYLCRSTHGSQKKKVDLMELEVQAIVIHLICMLGIKSGYLEDNSLNHLAIS